jgi:branched-chain amino acid transport system substrate-binding protein
VRRAPSADVGDAGLCNPFNYTSISFFWGLEDVISVFTNTWRQLATNKSVGGLFPNDCNGNALGDKQVGFPPVIEKLGYKLTDPRHLASRQFVL